MRVNPFEEKRLTTFMELGTDKSEWKRAEVVNFTYQSHTNKKGKLIEEWIPVYRIPEGYENPLEKDVLNSKERRCQLCDTKIKFYGILLHEEKKQFLVVGMECYVVYETDDDRLLKAELLARLKEEHIQTRLNEEKQKIIEGLKLVMNDEKRMEMVSYNMRNEWYNCYSTIQRNHWVVWSRTKLVNFLVKYAYYIHNIIKYTPATEIFGAKKEFEFYKKAGEKKIYVDLIGLAMKVCEREHKSNYGNIYYIRNIKTNELLSDFYKRCVEAMNKGGIDKMKKVLGMTLPVHPEAWKYDMKY